MLDVASQLFYEQGIHAVGVEAIASGAGVTKKTLYACFGAKDRLVAFYLTERDRNWRVWLEDWLAPIESPRERLLNVFDALDSWMENQNTRGCGFVNALAELPDPKHPAHPVILRQKSWMLDQPRALADSAGVTDPVEVAYQALLLYEGAVVAYSADLPQPVSRARKTVEQLLELGK